MGCNSCGTPEGCGSKGNCGTGSCNKMSTFDWLSHLGIDDSRPSEYVEVSFGDGASKGFYHCPPSLGLHTGDRVAVETRNGYNVGRISLSGELVRLQMKKKRVKAAKVTNSVLRRANERDLEKEAEARSLEPEGLLKSRLIVRTNHLPMKVTAVEYQGDCRKATVYYTADERIDYRQIVRQFSHQLRVKIEMCQIGPRQEAARLGGIGSCGRELCCSTWLSDFQSVNTSAARYQQIAINSTKLSGQCGRLKCCLNYELNTYMEAIETYPKKSKKLQTEAGTGVLVKTDIFKGVMYYTYRENRGPLFALPVARVHEIVDMNAEGRKPADLQSFQLVEAPAEDTFEYEDVTGAVELPSEKRRRGKKKRRPTGGKPGGRKPAAKRQKTDKKEGTPSANTKKRRNRRRRKPGKPKSDT